jgi:BppU N-terminal domain
LTSKPDRTIKRGDTWPPLAAELVDQDGPIDLTTASTVKMLLKSDTISIKTGPVTIDEDPKTGRVLYEWETGDTDNVGLYNGEFEITWESGKVETVPDGDDEEKPYFMVNIYQDLG